MVKKVERTFDTLSEFVGYAMRDTDMPMDYRSSRKAERGGGWYGSPSFKAAESMAFNWQEGADRVNKIRAQVSLGNIRKAKTVQAMKRAPGRLDMGRVMTGNPYAFVRVIDHETELTKGQARNVVDILVNCCVSAGVSTETIEARGAAMLALAEALEQCDRRVRITVGMANEGARGKGNAGIDYKVVVKQPGQRLNLNSIAFAVAHPSFFRRFVFSAMETESAAVRSANGVGSGYGYVAEFKDVPESTIYMGGSDLRRSDLWNDPDYIQGWIKHELGKQGIVIDE